MHNVSPLNRFISGVLNPHGGESVPVHHVKKFSGFITTSRDRSEGSCGRCVVPGCWSSDFQIFPYMMFGCVGS